jgi:formamidopyrimidine-DNA glycosylase
VNISQTELNKVIDGEKLISIQRKAKYLVFVFKNNYLVLHMRMAGNFTYSKQGKESKKYTLVEFQFTNGYELNFDDFRKFATCTYYTGYKS